MKKKIKLMLFMNVILITFLCTNILVFAKYLIFRSVEIDINTASYYFELSDTMVVTNQTNINIPLTTKNNINNNITEENINYEIINDSNKFNLSTASGFFHTLTGNTISNKSFSLSLTPKIGSILSNLEFIDILFQVNKPFSETNLLRVVYDNLAPDIYTPVYIIGTDYIKIENTTTDNYTSFENLKFYYSIDNGTTFTLGTANQKIENLVCDTTYDIVIKVVDEAGNERIISDSVTTFTYILDDLVLMLDGYDNTRSGQNPSNSTLWEDLSGNNYDAVLTAVIYDSVRKAYYFNGTTSYGSLPLGLNITAPCTIEIVMDTSFRSGIVFSEKSGFFTIGFFTNQNGFIVVGDNLSTSKYASFTRIYPVGEANIPFNLNMSYYATSPFNAASYVNNTMLYKDTVNTNWWKDTIGGNYIGRRVSTNNMFQGRVYAIRVYDRVLTPSEREQNYLVDKEKYGL